MVCGDVAEGELAVELAHTGRRPRREPGSKAQSRRVERREWSRLGPPTGEAEGGGDIEDLEGVLELDERGGELGDVREGGLEDLAAVPAGLADEDGGRGVAVGDALNIHG